jgi:CubicO group peptidase (beta-lactamase class C family)
MRLLLLLLLPLTIHAQLQQYEGTYEYGNPATLQISVSPKDAKLYAIISGSKYLLRQYKQDTFLNNSDQQVIFLRHNNAISGYIADGHTYRLINRQVAFTWIARKDTRYQYRIPADRHDGLPTGSIINSGLDTALIHTLIDRIIDGTYPDVHSILLIKDGKLILEEYFYGYNAHTRHQLRSASKSITGIVTGIAISKGLIRGTDEKISRYFPTYKIADITIHDLLTQQSGLACDDRDPNSPGNEVKIYPNNDWISYILQLPMSYTPGTKARYCSGNTILLDRIIETASGQSLSAFAKANLFAPLGIHDYKWEFAPDKIHENDFGQLHMLPLDMAKIGLLVLNKGQWKGKQVLPPDFVQASVTKQSVVDGMDYGYLWWLETLNGIPGIAAKGNGGQRIFIWPGLNMVAVVTAGNYNQQSPANKLLMECVLKGLQIQSASL